jgi:hypothetical protein
MRAFLPIALVAAFALAACSGPCDELANRLCDCPPSGVSSDTCRRQGSEILGKKKPSDAQCSHWLDTCQAPSGLPFCDWMNSRCGKASCGISAEDPGTAPGDACAPATTTP